MTNKFKLVVVMIVISLAMLACGISSGDAPETIYVEGTAPANSEPAAIEEVAEEATEEATGEVTEEATEEAADEAPGFVPINTTEVDNLKTFRQGLPAHVTFRDMVIEKGDDAVGVVVFGRDYANIVVNRVVCDDTCTGIMYYPVDGDPVNLLPLFQMFHLDAGGTGNANTDLVLESRGLNLAEGEILDQNLMAVELGAVKAGSYIVVKISDDPTQGVNNGALIAVTADSDPLTVSLVGVSIEFPTFIPEGWKEE